MAGKGILGFLAVVFLLIGGSVAYFGCRNLDRARESESWPKTMGKVILSDMTTHSDSDSTTYRASILYTYSVGAVAYSSSRVAFGEVSTSDPNDAYKITRKYPKDAVVDVYYKRQDPSMSVLEPGLSWKTYFLPVFGLVFFLVGVALAYGFYRAVFNPPASLAEPMKVSNQ